MVNRIKKYVKNELYVLKCLKLCRANFNMYKNLSRKEIKEKITYSRISINLFYLKRGSGATRFVNIMAAINALTNEKLNIIIVKKNKKTVDAKDIFNTDSADIFNVGKSFVMFENGSSISYISERELKFFAGDDIDAIYLDDYNSLDISKDIESLKSHCSADIVKMYRR